MANTQTSVPVFTSGQVLTAQQQTEINTGIPVFADSTARDAAFGGTGEKLWLKVSLRSLRTRTLRSIMTARLGSGWRRGRFGFCYWRNFYYCNKF
jgi:hypothetical protein